MSKNVKVMAGVAGGASLEYVHEWLANHGSVALEPLLPLADGSFSGKDVLSVRRFDRTEISKKIPYLSTMSMLGAGVNEQHSYLEIVDTIRQYGASPKEDLRQL